MVGRTWSSGTLRCRRYGGTAAVHVGGLATLSPVPAATPPEPFACAVLARATLQMYAMLVPRGAFMQHVLST
jgi:hypothetical protein